MFKTRSLYLTPPSVYISMICAKPTTRLLLIDVVVHDSRRPQLVARVEMFIFPLHETRVNAANVEECDGLSVDVAHHQAEETEKEAAGEVEEAEQIKFSMFAHEVALVVLGQHVVLQILLSLLVQLRHPAQLFALLHLIRSAVLVVLRHFHDLGIPVRDVLTRVRVSFHGGRGRIR